MHHSFTFFRAVGPFVESTDNPSFYPKGGRVADGSHLDFPTLSATMNKEPGASMNIEIRDAALQARIQKQVEATRSGSVEEVLLHLLETQEEQDRWLLENRDEINVKIRQGLDQLDRGEGIPEDQLDSYLTKLKAKSE